MRIVPLDKLKLALGVDPESTDDDELLADLESRAADWVEHQTERAWGQPAEREQIIVGQGLRALYLGGHIDDTVDTPPTVTLRARAINGGEWETVDAEEIERRGDTIIRLDGSRFSRYYEYEVTYPDGWVTAPGDIMDLVIDLVSIAWSGMGEEGVKSESIGDYSYTLDTAVSAALSSLADLSVATLDRRRPRHI